MPWCAECDRFYNPNTLEADGTCPTCGRQVGEPEKLGRFSDDPAPWHFKVLMVMVALYLGWRFLELFF